MAGLLFGRGGQAEQRVLADTGWIKIRHIRMPFGDHAVAGQNQGIDIAAYGGSDIISVLSGTVITARWHDSYGYYVVVYHGDGLSTLYAHASKLLVKEGDYVSRGQVIALVGSTGSSTGNHLHFEVRINGETRDPLDYLPNKFG